MPTSMRLFLLFLAIALAAGCASAPVQTPMPAPPTGPAPEQLQSLVNRSFSAYNDVPARQPNGPVVHRFEVRRNETDSAWLWHQRRYPNDDRTASRWLAYPLTSIEQSSAARLMKAGATPQDSDSPDDASSRPFESLNDCRMGWRQDAGDWVLSTTQQGCAIGGSDAIVQSLRFDANGIDWSVARPGADSQVTTRLWPVQQYTGWIGFRDRLSVESEKWQRLADIRLRDIGDQYRLIIPVSQREFVIELRRHHYADSQRQLLQLKVIEQGELLASAWAPPNTGHIGLHLPWLQIGLRLDKPPATQP